MSINPSGMSARHRRRAQDMAIHAAVLALHHAPNVHYTQDARRWEGIAHGLRAWKGEYPRHADCSAFVTWCIWNGLTHYRYFRHRDPVNGEHWDSGFTGTMLRHGRSVRGRTLRRCDAVIYGRGWPGEHTALYVGGGKVISHGSEGGPFLLPMHYRGDIIDIRRYI